MECKLPIMNQMVSDLPSHTVGCALQHTIIKQKQYVYASGPVLMELTTVAMFLTILKQLANKMMECPFEYMVIALSVNFLQLQSKVLQEAVYTQNQHQIYASVFPITRIPESRNQGMEITITHSNSLAKFLLCFCNLMLCWPSSLSTRVRNAYTRKQSIDSIELEVKTATVAFGLFLPLN